MGKLDRAEDGSLRGEAVVTRAGVFSYRGPGGETIRELRPAEEVFHADSLASARMLPVTIEHPPERKVSPDNAQALSVGWTGENVRQDGASVVAPIRITARAGIAAVEAGKQQLSLGYRCEVERCDGIHDGQSYSRVQRRIRYNHLALTDVARAGSAASVRLDAADAIQIEGPPPPAPPAGTTGRTRTMQLRLDSGISYEVPPEVEAAWREKAAKAAELQTKLDSATAEKDAAVKARDSAAGERDAAKAELEKVQKTDRSDEIKAAVKARIALEGAAHKAKLGKETLEKLDSMTDDEIKVAVIKSRSKDFDPAGKTAEYVQARFDSVVELLPTEPDHGKTIAGDGTRSDGCTGAEAAKKKAIDEMKARSRGKKTE